MFRELCGDSTLKNVVLVTNMWGKVSQDVGEARENELSTKFFKQVLDNGAQLVRHYNTTQSAHDIIRRIMKNRPVALQIQRELVEEGKDIINTSAGEAINKELNELIRRHQAELKEVREEMMQALRDKDEQTKIELEAETRRLQEQMDKMKLDSETMVSSYLEEKKRMEEAIKQMQEQARQEKDDLTKQLQEGLIASAAEREELQKKLDQLQHQWDDRWQCVLM